MPNFEQNDLDLGYDGDLSQADIDRQREIDYHCAHCGPCIRDEHCKTLERIWNVR